MSQSRIVFDQDSRIGTVTGVDTSHVFIDVDSPQKLARVGITNLVAIEGPSPQQYLIGMVERVNRSLREDLDEQVNVELMAEEIPIGLRPVDVVRAVLVGTYRVVEGDKTNVFKRGADAFPQVDRQCFLIQGKNLQNFMGILGSHIPVEERLRLGCFVADPDAEAVADGDRFFQRHAAILGSTGSGKSWAVGLILERASKLAHPNIIVFDMHGEYAPLTAKDGYAESFRIAGPGDLTRSSNVDNVLYLPYWMLNREEMLSMFLDRSDNNAPNQAARFTSHVRDLKYETLKKEGKNKTLETFTMDSPIPYDIDHLLDRLRDDDTRKGIGANNKPVKGEWEGKLTRFISRLEAKIEDRRYGFLFQPPKTALQYDWLARQVSVLLGESKSNRGIKVVDFSEVPSDVLPIVTGTLARLLYDVQFWMRPDKRRPFTLVCDEAHIYLPVRDEANAPERQALEVFERIAKEGRKYGTSLLVISQRPSDVSRTILSQCNNFVVLRLTNDRDQATVRRLLPDSMAGVTDMLPLLDTGEALILGDSVLLPARVKLDIPLIKPDSGTRDFWTEWGTLEPEPDFIQEAVETLRMQTRPID